MENSELAKGFIEVLLSWMRLITGWVWDFFQADMSGGFLVWFDNHWKGLAVALVIIGVLIDWIIWMIRWRPYWVWFRKRQIVYENVEPKKESKTEAAGAQREPRHKQDIYSKEGMFDPYAAQNGKQKDEWDAPDDPYARSAK